MCSGKPRLVLVSLLIGWNNGARTLNQSLSEVMQNQSNSLTTFDTQWKTALYVKCFQTTSARWCSMLGVIGVLAGLLWTYRLTRADRDSRRKGCCSFQVSVKFWEFLSGRCFMVLILNIMTKFVMLLQCGISLLKGVVGLPGPKGPPGSPGPFVSIALFLW